MEEESKSKRMNLFENIILVIITAIITAVISHVVTKSLSNTDKLEGRINDFDKKIIRLEEQYQAFVNFRKEKEIDDIRNSVNNNQEILNKFEANAFQIRLNIPQEFINNSNSNPIEVNGYSLNINVDMRNDLEQNISGYYVHILQIESGVGVDYYYQGSTHFMNEQRAVIPVYLGRSGTIDLNKNYQIVAIINQTPSYRKINDVKRFSQLPDKPKAVLTVKRVL